MSCVMCRISQLVFKCGAHMDMWHPLIGWKSKVDDKEDKEILPTNCKLTCDKRSTLPLDQFSQPDLEKEKEREKEKNIDFKGRVSNFSLDFLAIGPSVSGDVRSKVTPHSKDYVWASVLGSFDKL